LKAKDAEMSCRVAFKSANLLKWSLVTAAAMFAICLLALVETTNEKAEAASIPQNGKIVFYRITPSDEHTIYTVDPDGSSLSLLQQAGVGGPPAWSPDGTKIAYDGIAVMDADGSNKRELPVQGGRMGFRSPTWSPDGTQLAFNTLPPVESHIPDIYTSDADGSDLTNITKSPEEWESAPDYSPNGLQMCFWGGNYKTGWGINIMNSDGSNPTRLAGDNHDRPFFPFTGGSCDWSPDGTKIAYSYRPESRGARYDVYVMNADGSGKINLTKSPKVGEDSPSWSPDGTKITFSSFRDKPGSGHSSIYTMDADGSNVTQVTTNPDATDIYPDWQPLTPESHSETVHPPDTGGPSLLLVASALLFSVGVLLYAGVKRRM
jgi:Tol biopolymer transport system component